MNGQGGWPPWSRIPSLKEMAEEIGIDYEVLIEDIKNDVDSALMARSYGITEETVENLKEHFYRYGISSVMGGD